MRRVLVAIVACAPSAHAEGPPRTGVELAVGHAASGATLANDEANAFGPGLGLRVARTVAPRLTLGGDLVQHLGWYREARAADGSASYRAAYRMAFAGADVGVTLGGDGPFLRATAGAGALVAFGRTSLGSVERRDDAVASAITTSLLVGLARDRRFGGLEVRGVFAPAMGVHGTAVGTFFVVGLGP